MPAVDRIAVKEYGLGELSQGKHREDEKQGPEQEVHKEECQLEKVIVQVRMGLFEAVLGTNYDE